MTDPAPTSPRQPVSAERVRFKIDRSDEQAWNCDILIDDELLFIGPDHKTRADAEADLKRAAEAYRSASLAQVPARPNGQSQSDAATEHPVAREPESVKDGYSPTQSSASLPVTPELFIVQCRLGGSDRWKTVLHTERQLWESKDAADVVCGLLKKRMPINDYRAMGLTVQGDNHE